MPRRRFPKGRPSGLEWESGSKAAQVHPVVTARWQGRCRECGGFYPPGALIVYRYGDMRLGQRGGYVHAAHAGVKAS